MNMRQEAREMFDLGEFVNESNKIEDIYGFKDSDLAAHDVFLNLDVITIGDIESFVDIIQPNARLRIKPGLDVRVGSYRPPAGGPQIAKDLQNVIGLIDAGHDAGPYLIHNLYEALHPFTDGNGRSGRVIWLWMMLQAGRAPTIGFLHTWYYQSLKYSGVLARNMEEFIK